jgi:Ca2+/H+ antiporter, TMEM165/GDT1 family
VRQAALTGGGRDFRPASSLGSTLGMVLADALAIGVGALLGRHLPERAIKYGAAAAFLVFGVLLIASGAGWL